MMTTNDMKAVVGRIRYKNWSVLLRTDEDKPYLQLRWVTQDVVAETISEQSSRKWMLSHYMTPSEIVQTALKAVLAAEEHEAREQFTYRGKAIFGPHFDVEELVKIVDRLDVR